MGRRRAGVFCESEFDRLGLDPIDAEKKITQRTRAMVVTHLWGMPAKMTEILRVMARRHNLRIIEDASHAQGAIWRDRNCGTLGDISVFSLQSSKLAPAGEGGMLLTDDAALMERAICLGDIVRIRDLQTSAYRFAATSFGIKTRMAPLSAAVAQVQLRGLEERNAERNASLYLPVGTSGETWLRNISAAAAHSKGVLRVCLSVPERLGLDPSPTFG